ncbi:MAG TPA: hypothetical protein VEN28_09025 [Burkholderiaceae bacterium]|nr:hypothetical protein [Burkholderiaceae bacterium]
MPNLDDPLEVLKRLSSNYGSLAAGFKSFHGGVARLSDDTVSPIKQSITVSGLQDNSFRVDFCGRAYEFEFRVAIDETGPLGMVVCREADGHFSDSFTFRPGGAADVEKPANYTLPIAVNDPAGAIYLVSRCLVRCLAATDDR